MSGIAGAAERVVRRLDALGLGYALVGGLAVSVRTEPRFTRDLDLVVAVADDAAAEHAIVDLLDIGFSALAMVEQDAVGRLATSRLINGDGQIVDLLFASSGIEGEVVESAEPIEVLPGLTLPVATVGHLIALKLLARDDTTRPQDAGDLVMLAAVATTQDLAVAESAVELITDRGFDRGRDLRAALTGLLPDPG